jgi:hypothetical protein
MIDLKDSPDTGASSHSTGSIDCTFEGRSAILRVPFSMVWFARPGDHWHKG